MTAQLASVNAAVNGPAFFGFKYLRKECRKAAKGGSAPYSAAAFAASSAAALASTCSTIWSINCSLLSLWLCRPAR